MRRRATASPCAAAREETSPSPRPPRRHRGQCRRPSRLGRSGRRLPLGGARLRSWWPPWPADTWRSRPSPSPCDSASSSTPPMTKARSRRRWPAPSAPGTSSVGFPRRVPRRVGRRHARHGSAEHRRPQHLLGQQVPRTRSGVKVALSGLGGDELLGGYPSFRASAVVAPVGWDRAPRARPFCRLAPGRAAGWPGDAEARGLMRYGRTLPAPTFFAAASSFPKSFRRSWDGISPRTGSRPTIRCGPGTRPIGETPCGTGAAVQALETGIYLRNQLLRDSDWASMAHSVELRVPFVDARLQAVAAESDFALPRTAGKRGVVQGLAPSLPAPLFQRRKTGFMVPTKAWLTPGRPLAPPADREPSPCACCRRSTSDRSSPQDEIVVFTVDPPFP